MMEGEWVEYVDDPDEPQERVLAYVADGRRAGVVNFIEVAENECHILSVKVTPPWRRMGLATDGVLILMTKYRYFSVDPMNGKILGSLRNMRERDDITGWPRVKAMPTKKKRKHA